MAQSHPQATTRASGQSFSLSLEHWRKLIRGAWMLGLLQRKMIQGAGQQLSKTTTMNTFYPSSLSEAFIANPSTVLLRKQNKVHNAIPESTASPSSTQKKSRESKGTQAAPLIRSLLSTPNYWYPITCSSDYQYPGVFDVDHPQRLGYCDDVTKLGLYTPSNPDFMYYDIQFGKGKPRNPQNITITLPGCDHEDETTLEAEYRIAPCRGVKLCGMHEQGCDYVTSTRENRPCPNHPSVPLVGSGDCPVEFVHIKPKDPNDNRRWQTGFVRGGIDMMKASNLHNHKLPPATRIPTKVQNDIKDAVKEDPHLKTTDLVEGLCYYMYHTYTY